MNVPTHRRTLNTRRGKYDLPHYDLWSQRQAATPITHVLKPGARVSLLGSCFAGQAADYLNRRGYRASTHPSGELYNPAILHQDLLHVFDDVPWPDEIGVVTDDGYAHRFRKRCRASTLDALHRLDREHTAAVRRQLPSADVILILIGTTTEMWFDVDTGLPTNEIPPPPSFHAGNWALDEGDLTQIVAHVRGTADVLARVSNATLVYGVCPIPLNATWSSAPIIAANGRVKALLRTALDLGLPADAVYLDLWDWVQAQSRWWTPMRADGRHFRASGVDRIMLFAEQRLGSTVQQLPLSHRAASFLKDLR